MNTYETWELGEAIGLCAEIEARCSEFGCHVALTGGVLYKEGPRKDLDLLFYRIRQVPQIDVDGLLAFLGTLGFTPASGFGFCFKTSFCGRNVDLFFPESIGGTYDEEIDPQDRQGPLI